MRAGSRWRKAWRVAGLQAVVVLALLVVWYGLSRAGMVSPIILPKPEAVAAVLPAILASPNTWHHLRLTAWEVIGAFALSLVSGLGLGLWAGRSRYATRLLEPLLVALYTVPIVLLYPICILLFGIGPASKIAFAGLYGFFPIALNAMRGLSSVEEKYITTAVSMGATERQLVWHVLLPAALPLVVAGVRIGAAFNLIGVIAGEMLASAGGLGYEIARTTQTFEIPALYAYVAITLVLIALFNAVVTRTGERGFYG